LVAEPTDLQTIIAARGDAYVMIDVAGHAAHAGNPADGVNAIYGAARIITELERWHHQMAAGERHRLVGAPTFSVGGVNGGTGTSIVPAQCRIAVDCRLLPGERGSDILARMRERIAHL